MPRNVVYYELDGHLIIGVELPDGRRFSIDIKTDNPESLEQKGDTEILVSARVMGRSCN